MVRYWSRRDKNDVLQRDICFIAGSYKMLDFLPEARFVTIGAEAKV